MKKVKVEKGKTVKIKHNGKTYSFKANKGYEIASPDNTEIV